MVGPHFPCCHLPGPAPVQDPGELPTGGDTVLEPLPETLPAPAQLPAPKGSLPAPRPPRGGSKPPDPKGSLPAPNPRGEPPRGVSQPPDPQGEPPSPQTRKGSLPAPSPPRGASQPPDPQGEPPSPQTRKGSLPAPSPPRGASQPPAPQGELSEQGGSIGKKMKNPVLRPPGIPCCGLCGRTAVNMGILVAVTRVISQISADNYKIHGDPGAFKPSPRCAGPRLTWHPQDHWPRCAQSSPDLTPCPRPRLCPRPLFTHHGPERQLSPRPICPPWGPGPQVEADTGEVGAVHREGVSASLRNQGRGAAAVPPPRVLCPACDTAPRTDLLERVRPVPLDRPPTLPAQHAPCPASSSSRGRAGPWTPQKAAENIQFSQVRSGSWGREGGGCRLPGSRGAGIGETHASGPRPPPAQASSPAGTPLLLPLTRDLAALAVLTSPQRASTRGVSSKILSFIALFLKLTAKAVAVLLPILGTSWVFGVLAVNNQAVVFQYMFAVLNSLQGFFIFLFHCLLNSEVRAAFKHKTKVWSLTSSSTRQANAKPFNSDIVKSPFLDPLWSADEWDPAWYRLHQAHPLGQEQPLRAPRGPVCRVSRAAADPAACRSEPPDPPQTARKHRSAFATGTLSLSLSGPGGHGPPPPPPVTASSPATRSCDRAHCPARSLIHGEGWAPRSTQRSLPFITASAQTLRTVCAQDPGAMAPGGKFSLSGRRDGDLGPERWGPAGEAGRRPLGARGEVLEGVFHLLTPPNAGSPMPGTC
eukprot:bmy_16445T0